VRNTALSDFTDPLNPRHNHMRPEKVVYWVDPIKNGSPLTANKGVYKPHYLQMKLQT
jgi:hypothetical protein